MESKNLQPMDETVRAEQEDKNNDFNKSKMFMLRYLSFSFNDLNNFNDITPCFLCARSVNRIAVLQCYLQQVVKILAATTTHAGTCAVSDCCQCPPAPVKSNFIYW